MSFLSADRARLARYGVPEATHYVAALDVDGRLRKQCLKLTQEPLRLLPASVLRFGVELNEERYCFPQREGRGFLRAVKQA
jgi:hypothetical protein